MVPETAGFGIESEASQYQTIPETHITTESIAGSTPISSFIMQSPSRVVHITFPKCGSQWVRDVLTAPEIVAYSHTPLHPAKRVSPLAESPEQPPGTVMGPIYNADYEAWGRYRNTGDKVVVVLRDPRDLAISHVYSMCYSHTESKIAYLWRRVLLPLDMRSRILVVMQQIVPELINTYISWAKRSTTATEYLTSYEKLVAAPQEEYARIVAFLGWNLPESVLNSVIHRLSFAERSGRQAGTEDVYSHYRKGRPGDWRRHFDRELGQTWEKVMPGLLSLLGYEKDNQWFCDLPEQSDDFPCINDASEATRTISLQAENVRLREENRELRKGLEIFQSTHGDQMDSVAMLQGVCEERLQLIIRLDRELKEHSQIIQDLRNELKHKKQLLRK